MERDGQRKTRKMRVTKKGKKEGMRGNIVWQRAISKKVFEMLTGSFVCGVVISLKSYCAI